MRLITTLPCNKHTDKSLDHGNQDHNLRRLFIWLSSAVEALENQAHRRREEAIAGADQEGYKSTGDYCAGEGTERGTAAIWYPCRCYGRVDRCFISEALSCYLPGPGLEKFQGWGSVFLPFFRIMTAHNDEHV